MTTYNYSDHRTITSGSYLTATTTTGTTWTTPSVFVSNSSSSNQLEVKGDANIDGNLIVKGVSINDSLERIEERLAILRPNEELEEKWEQLRGLRKAYMDLEAEIKEKEEVWKILKR